MRVSVIVPYTPRDRDLLDRALTSVNLQTYDDIEVVPVFDEHYNGIPWARNTGFAQCTGELILPLDCDDWIDPKYLEKTVPQIVDGVGIVSTEMVYHGMLEGKVMPIRIETYDSELEENKITVTSLVRREAIEQAGPWDDNLKGWEDWDMWLRILRNGWKHAVISEPLFHYRLSTGGMNQWANEHKGELYRYLAAKHPGFAAKRAAGQKWNEI